MIRQNLTLLPNCSGQVSFEGEPVKAIGYYSNDTNDRLNTISIYTKNFTGRIYIYGTLKVNPTENDWFIIPLTEETDYLEFNHHGVMNSCIDNTYVNIKGAYTWLKAKMDREYLNVIKTPVPINYHITSGTCAQNVGDHVITQNKVVQVSPAPSPDLKYCGNIQCIKLTY